MVGVFIKWQLKKFKSQHKAHMTISTPLTGLQLRSLIVPEGTLELSLVDEAVPRPAPDEVVVRI